MSKGWAGGERRVEAVEGLCRRRMKGIEICGQRQCSSVSTKDAESQPNEPTSVEALCGGGGASGGGRRRRAGVQASG